MARQHRGADKTDLAALTERSQSVVGSSVIHYTADQPKKGKVIVGKTGSFSCIRIQGTTHTMLKVWPEVQKPTLTDGRTPRD